jgi:hypothetical protein
MATRNLRDIVQGFEGPLGAGGVADGFTGDVQFLELGQDGGPVASPARLVGLAVRFVLVPFALGLLQPGGSVLVVGPLVDQRMEVAASPVPLLQPEGTKPGDVQPFQSLLRFLVKGGPWGPGAHLKRMGVAHSMVSLAATKRCIVHHALIGKGVSPAYVHLLSEPVSSRLEICQNQPENVWGGAKDSRPYEHELGGTQLCRRRLTGQDSCCSTSLTPSCEEAIPRQSPRALHAGRESLHSSLAVTRDPSIRRGRTGGRSHHRLGLQSPRCPAARSPLPGGIATGPAIIALDGRSVNATSSSLVVV